jgi:hypothetical protein
MTARRLSLSGMALLSVLGWTCAASGQYPPQQQPYPPPQPYPPQPYPQQPQAPYPPQQPYPPPQYGPPPPTYPQQYQTPYPPYGQTTPPPQQLPPPPGPSLQPPPQPVYGPQVAPPPRPTPGAPPPNRYRSSGEMAYLYGVGAAYGIGTGIWIDLLANVTDPGIAMIAPLVLGGAVPVGLYAWDSQQEFDRGVASSIATGMLLGGIEGIAIDGLQWQLTGNPAPDNSKLSMWSTIAFAGATAGGLGGYAFGEWLQPDPRSLAFIASGAGWGSIAGILFGSGVVTAGSEWADGAAVGGFAGYNAGIVATGALSAFYTPSWQSVKYMWLGDLLGTLATTPVYLFYLGGGEARHGLIANAVGGLAGIGVAAALTAGMTDSGSASWSPPFQLSVAPTPGGIQANAFGSF